MTAREKYHAGLISAEEYVRHITESEEGDRRRRKIVKEHEKTVAQVGDEHREVNKTSQPGLKIII